MMITKTRFIKYNKTNTNSNFALILAVTITINDTYFNK